MKKIKFITAALLIFVALMSVGELYVWHISSFETNYPYTTMYLQKETTQIEMKEDIKKAAENYNVDIFVVEKKMENLFSQHISIYGTSAAIKKIEEKSDITSGKYQSILLGNIEVRTYSFDRIDDLSDVSMYYLIGENDDIIEFKVSLVDKYAGRFPQFPSTNNESRNMLLIVWVVVYMVIILLTRYETTFLKKEILIRVISGENLNSIILKNILNDLLFYLFCFTSSIVVLHHISNISYCMYETIICFVLFLFVNSSVFIFLYNVDYKRDIIRNVSAKNTLFISYILKTISMILITIIIAGNIEMVLEGIDFYRQKNFFEEHNKYSYLTISPKDNEDRFSINRALYKKALEEGKTISLVNLGKWDCDKNYVLADRGANEYLELSIEEIKVRELEDKMYFFVPEKDVSRKDVIREMKEIWESYYQGEYEFEIITYKNRVNIIAVENIGKVKSEILSNPVVIYNNMAEASIDDYWNIGYISNSTMYTYNSDELEGIMKDNEEKTDIFYQTNVYDNYLFQWQVMKRNLYTGLVFSCLLLILEIFIIKTIIEFEYKVNAAELSLKKIYGYTFVSRYKGIFMITLLIGGIILLSTIVIDQIYEVKFLESIIIGELTLISLEIFYIIVNIYKVEQKNIQGILKGEII